MTGRAAKLVAWNLLAALALLLLFEGCSRLVLAWSNDAQTSNPAGLRVLREAQHTDYDPEIGWINRANVHIPNLYGPGRSFTTDERALRTTHTRPAPSARPTVRLVCSGDSFTMGYGVDDEDTWCNAQQEVRLWPNREGKESPDESEQGGSGGLGGGGGDGNGCVFPA